MNGPSARTPRLDPGPDLGPVPTWQVRLVASCERPERADAAAPGGLMRLVDIFGYEVLLEALDETLPGNRPIAGLYQEDDPSPALYVRLHVSDVGLLHELRDLMLEVQTLIEANEPQWSSMSPQCALTSPQ